MDTNSASATLNIGILVFREGLECILVLSALTSNLTGQIQNYRRPIAGGVVVGLGATLLTWFLAVRILDDLSQNIPALHLQAATGLLAIIVLLIVMNWFFHKVYWGGWISLQNRHKQEVLKEVENTGKSGVRLWWGLGLLGFASLYREGFEVVLFLQSYRLQLGSEIVGQGVLDGLLFTAVVALATFWLHQRLPFRKMLIATGVLLAFVLLVMVGEQAQEMQLAGWIPTTDIAWLKPYTPDWVGLWFAVFPTLETLVLQGAAALLVAGSYLFIRYRKWILPVA